MDYYDSKNHNEREGPFLSYNFWQMNSSIIFFTATVFLKTSYSKLISNFTSC